MSSIISSWLDIVICPICMQMPKLIIINAHYTENRNVPTKYVNQVTLVLVMSSHEHCLPPSGCQSEAASAYSS